MTWPRPGQANTVSTMTAPASRLEISSAATVITGMAALRARCRQKQPSGGHASGAGRAHVVLGEFIQQRGAGDAGEGRHAQEPERDRRHDQMLDAAGRRRRQPAEGHGEHHDQQDAAPEGRHALRRQNDAREEARKLDVRDRAPA